MTRSPLSRHIVPAAPAGIAVVLLGVTLAFRTTPAAARPGDPTFADDVAPIFYKNCVPCHHDGGMAPFSLVEYDTAAAHVDQMRGAVEQGDMPPWHAAGPRGVFVNDRRLADADKATILRWIDSGMKPGDLTHLPPKPEFPTGWVLGEPDAILTMPDSFTVPAAGKVDYQYFQIKTPFTDERWIQSIEVRPTARAVVHHVLVYAYTPPIPQASATPPVPRPAGAPAFQPTLIRNRAWSATPKDEPRDDSLHGPPRVLGAVIGVYVPGTSTIEFPKGTALRLRPGTVLTFQMHYTAHGHEMTDRTSVGFHFASAPPAEEVFVTQFINGAFTLPAGAKDVAVPAEIGAGRPIKIWGILPHTHLRGTRWQYTLVQPDSSRQVVLDVPHYDFNWQTYYMFATPLEVPAGSKLESMAWYDNSATNKHNPDPTVDVHWGDQTWNEMQYTSMIYSVARPKATPGVH